MLGAGRRRGIDRIVSVFAVIAGMAFLAAILMTADHALIRELRGTQRPRGALDDQRMAAAIMWVTGMAITLPLLLLTVWRWATLEQTIAERREALERLHGADASSSPALIRRDPASLPVLPVVSPGNRNPRQEERQGRVRGDSRVRVGSPV